jgi:hypothetical protein
MSVGFKITLSDEAGDQTVLQLVPELRADLYTELWQRDLTFQLVAPRYRIRSNRLYASRIPSICSMTS